MCFCFFVFDICDHVLCCFLLMFFFWGGGGGGGGGGGDTVCHLMFLFVCDAVVRFIVFSVRIFNTRPIIGI